MMKCWDLEPKDRPTFKQLLAALETYQALHLSQSSEDSFEGEEDNDNNNNNNNNVVYFKPPSCSPDSDNSPPQLNSPARNKSEYDQ